MENGKTPLIYSVDDDALVLERLRLVLNRQGYQVETARSGQEALQALDTLAPDLILLDVMMPEMNGYDVCKQLQTRDTLAYVPVLFFTALGERRDRARAFAVGAVDYLTKPITTSILLDKVALHLQTHARWQALPSTSQAPPETAPETQQHTNTLPGDFTAFKQFVLTQTTASLEQSKTFTQLSPGELFSGCAGIGLTPKQVAQYMAAYLQLPYVPHIHAETLRLGVLPAPFCHANHVVAVTHPSAQHAFVLSNPFRWELLDALQKTVESGGTYSLVITEPTNVETLFVH